MKEKYHYVLGETSQSRKNNSVIWMVIVTILLIMIGLGVMIGVVYNDHNDVRKRVEILEGEIMVLRDMLNKETILEFDRSRRDALYPNQYDVQNPIKENISEYTQDGVPVVSRQMKYKGFAKDRTGFRVYNAWYQQRRENKIRNDPRVVVKHATDAPIRPHHRKSAAWSGGSEDDKDDEFLDFGDSMYSDSNASSSSSSSSSNSRPVNSVSYTRNRAKITNVQNYREENRNYNPTTSSTTTTTPPATTQAAVARTSSSSSRTNLNDHMRSKMLEMKSVNMRTGQGHNAQRGARNRMGLRSGGSAVEARKHVTAIHLEGEVPRVGGVGSGGRIQLSDGVFRDWSVSRWAKRMHMNRKIKLDQGILTVGSPGIYFIYAQINYLDDHDVNAFQIMVNKSPWLMCTTMTHTPRATTKANTCYTGGVRYLEQGDTLMIKNTDTNRFAVMLPSHSFFGLVQLSEMGM